MRSGKFGFISAVILMMLFSLPVHAADVAKIGVIDFQKVLTESERGKSVQDALQKKGRDMQKHLTELGNRIQDLSDQLNRDAMVMSDDKREEKQRELDIKKYDFQTMQKKYQTEFRDQESKEVDKLRGEIFDLADQIGKKEGYLLIIEKSAAIYYPSSIDITDLIIEKYNETNKDAD